MDYPLVKSSFVLSEDDSYITTATGTVYTTGEDDRITYLGILEAEIVRMSHRLNDGLMTTGNAMDWVGQVNRVEVEEVLGYVTKNADFYVSKQLEKALGDDLRGECIFYIHSVEIQPEHRGHGLGLKIVYDFIRTIANLASAGLVICQPAPINDCKGKERYAGVSDKLATKKLQEYWSKLGLVKLPRSEYYGMVPNRLKTPPEIEQWSR